MRPQHVLEPELAGEVHEATISVGHGCDLWPRELERRTILLLSRDTRLHENLRGLANTAGRTVVRLDDPAGVVAMLHAVRPAAVLVDLELPKRAAWEVGEALSQEQSCPPVFLLTFPSKHSNLRTALRGRFVIDKSETPSHLLEAVEEILATPESSQAERNAIQRAVIGWLKPSNWPIPRTATYRFWGINE